jgi:hypothetical protein
MALAWLLWCLGLAGGCALGAWRGVAAAGPWPWGLAMPAALLALALIRPGWRWLLGRGPLAPRRLSWLADGRWWLERRDGWAGYVTFSPPRRLGPFVWLQGRSPHGHMGCLLDGATMEPNALRLLKARVGSPAPIRGEGPIKGA